MRSILILIFAALLFTGCEEIETNTPGFQVVLNDELFKAVDSRAEIRPDGSLVIQGLTDFEKLSIVLNNSTPGTYTFGSTGTNRAVFVDFENSVYTTIPFGNGSVEITEVNNTISGTFRFNAFRFGLDTLNAQMGVMYKVPIIPGSTDDIPMVNVNMMGAVVEGESFSANSVTVNDIDDEIIISGTQGNRTIVLTFPDNITNGNHPLGTTTHYAEYIETGDNFMAETGNLTIINHNTASNNISGTFSFQTGEPDNLTISQGNFNVTY